MHRCNKAHTATLNRIAKRYGAKDIGIAGVDIHTPLLTIEVETQATLVRGLRHLRTVVGPAYLAVTNKEAVADALRLTAGTPVGVMDPRGNILKPAEPELDGEAAFISSYAPEEVSLLASAS